MNFDKLTAYLDSLEESYGIPGLDILVMKDHQAIYRHQAGHRDYEKKEKVDGTELYDIYSATKVITMTAVMQLIEQGIIGLEDEVSKYLPAFAQTRVYDNYDYAPFPAPMPGEDAPTRPVKNPIRIRHLMSMTGGLTYNLGHSAIQEKIRAGAGTVELMEGIAKMPLVFEPGQRFCYSLCHDVLAAVVEVASGERFADYLDNHVFKPLGIRQMYMHPGEAEKARLAAQWSCDFVTGEIKAGPTGNVYRFHDRYDSGGAGLTAAVEDYCTVMDALACGGVGKTGHRILKPESIALLATDQLNEQQRKDLGREQLGYSYGLGVRTMIFPERSKSPVGEFGWDGAAGAFSLADPVNRLSIYYAQQVLGMGKVYFEVHPAIRDLVYEALEAAGE